MQQQRVLLRRRCGEVPDLVPGEPLGLRVHAQRPRRRGWTWPAAASRQPADLLRVDAELAGPVRVALRRVRGRHQVLLGHQVGVDVVVGQRAVLVRAGDPVDVELPLGVVVAEGAPQPRGVGQQLQPGPAARTPRRRSGQHVADHRVGDVGVDVEGGGAGGPVAPSTPAPAIVRHGNAAPFRPSWVARSMASGSVLCRQRSALAAASGLVSAQHAAARTSRCPRTRARRTRARSGPSPGWPGSPPGRPACSTWNSAKRTACWTSVSPSTSTSARSQKSSR